MNDDYTDCMDVGFYVRNRKQLSERLGGGIIVLAAYAGMQLSADTEAPFVQEANFWYLSGIEEPDWQLIVDGARGKSWLVMPDVSETQRIFTGGVSANEAKRISGVDVVVTSDKADELLRQLARKHSVVHSIGDDPYAAHHSFTLNPAPKKVWQKLERIFNDVQDCRLELARLRAIKQPAELRAIQRAVTLTKQAFVHAKEQLPQRTTEYELEAEFTYLFRRHGADHAYAPIVAGGKNACTLHYGSNAEPLKKRSLVLIDIGARVDGYAADITRTYAVGHPTSRQLAVHHALEQAHQEIIALVGPELAIEHYQTHVDTIMKQALMSLGLLATPDDEVGYRRYFPHAISHGLGVDVHDSLGRPTKLLPGMVLTVEPGIYIPEEEIGVRIEDDVVITETGHKNLSKGLSTSL